MNDLRITVNGEPRSAAPGTTVAALVAQLGMDAARVAVERNQDVVPAPHVDRGPSSATGTRSRSSPLSEAAGRRLTGSPG